MAADRRLDERPVGGGAGVGLIAAGVLVVSLAGVGTGFRNGDAAVYAAQAAAGDLGERTIHVGWIALGALLAPLAGDALPMALDVVNALCAVVAVTALGRRGGIVAAAVFAAAVLPEASWAEVDVPWVAAIALATVVRAAPAAILAAAAVALSPTALLAVPWLVAERRDAWGAVGAALTVVVLTAATAGAWWSGDRGVLEASLAPGRSVEAWLVHTAPLLPAVVLALAAPGRAKLLAALPCVLAPPDVPAWLVLHAAIALAASETRPRPALLVPALIAQVTVAGLVWERTRATIAAEDRAIRAAIADLAPGDVVVAPWSWGVRASVLATGEPYELPWRPPGTPVRSPVPCDGRAVLLPPGRPAPSLSDLPGCAAGTVDR